MHIPCHDVVVATLNFLLTHIAYMYVDDDKLKKYLSKPNLQSTFNSSGSLKKD